jgi:hypothetical protein
MQLLPYRNDLYYSWITRLLILFLAFHTLSCKKKETVNSMPSIAFIAGLGYTAHDTTLMTGQKIKVGISVQGDGANITYFSIRYNDGSRKIILDTGMNRPALTYEMGIIKTSSPVETWTFLVMDRNRQQDSIRIILTRSDSSKWGRISTRTGIVLGAQENTDSGSFYSFASGRVFTLSQAFLDQAAVDLVYYYGQYEGTLASPAEAEAPGFFTGNEGIANWTIKNETRYDTTSVSAEDFDLAMNDSLLLAAYEPAAGKRKAKYLQPGMVVSFKSPSGKLGLIKVTALSGTAAGLLEFSVKIQDGNE